jgi:hypothetical protein
LSRRSPFDAHPGYLGGQQRAAPMEDKIVSQSWVRRAVAHQGLDHLASRDGGSELSAPLIESPVFRRGGTARGAGPSRTAEVNSPQLAPPYHYIASCQTSLTVMTDAKRRAAGEAAAASWFLRLWSFSLIPPLSHWHKVRFCLDLTNCQVSNVGREDAGDEAVGAPVPAGRDVWIVVCFQETLASVHYNDDNRL